MKKIIKSAILTVTGFLFLLNSYCQNQSDLTESIKQKFLNYTTAVPREEIYVHSDRDEYIAGEYLWFNIYLFDRKSSELSDNSRIAYFEVLNSENRPVVQKRILLNKGIGPGQIVLPDTLSPGMYTVRAYTSWMKNFMPGNCFMKDIKIYNSFSNKPFRNKTYNESNKTLDTGGEGMPERSTAGLTLEVNNKKTDKLQLNIRCAEQFRSENSNMICLFIETRGSINRVSTEKVNSDFTQIYIPRKELGTGINHITIFNSEGQPVSEKYVYSPGQDGLGLIVNTIDSSSIRSRVTIDIESSGLVIDSLDLQNLSISVSPETGIEEAMSIKDYMVFGTEFGLHFLNSFRNKKLSELTTEAIDQLLFSVKSDWIDWDLILSSEPYAFKFRMEKEEHLLLGRMISPGPLSSGPAGFVLMSSPGKEPEFQYALPDEEGYFSFSLQIDERQNDLIIMPDNVSEKSKLLIESSFSDKYTDSGASVDSEGDPEPLHIQMYSANYQIGKIYKIAPSGKPLTPDPEPYKPMRFYDMPDIGLILSDYVSLPTMEEIFFELIPRVSLKKKKSGYEILITDRINDNQYVLNPVLMIDGVKVKDASVIAELNPELVERIDVIKELYIVGRYTFSGLVNVITKSGDYSCVPLDDYMTRLKYRVTDPVLTFPLPDHSKKDSVEGMIPDFRNTLYWNPSLKSVLKGKSELTFWTSDIPLEYIINIQGVSSEGNPVFFKKRLSVF